jgi:hypothetical protein
MDGGVCERVVFDTSAFWACNEAALQGLRVRRLRLSISLLAIHEAWARAVREHWEQRFLRTVRMLDPYFDLRMPVVPTMGQLMDLIGAAFRDGRPAPTGLHQVEMARRMWRSLAEGRVDDPLFQEGGARAKEEKTRYAGSAVRVLKETATDFPTLASEQTRDLAVHVARVQDAAASTPEGAYERLNALCHVDAHLKVTAVHSDTAFLESPKREHDAIDVGMLMHVAQPALVAMQDYRFILHVDESGTFQAPWVRTLGELCTEDLPSGLPWGTSAREVAGRHKVRTKKDLAAIDARIGLRNSS